MKSLLILAALLPGTALLSAREKPARFYRKSFQIEETGQFNVNRIACDLEANGMIVSHRITGHSGLEWPRGNATFAVFASGLWLAGKVDGDIRTACAEYGPELAPGPWGSDSLDPGRKLFSVYKSDQADPEQNDDFQNWPVDLGAPWIDANNNGSYEPLPYGPDYPDVIGDQVIWYVSNDGDTASHILYKTESLGIEVQTTIFGFNRQDEFGDIMFVKELILNKSAHTIDSMYVGVWSDPDLGDAGDDFVGCDTILDMGICYNDGIDPDYENFPGGTPAVGYDLFQGPMVPADGDTAFGFGTTHANMKNLRMTAFRNVDKGWSPYQDPGNREEVYYALKGLDNSGLTIIDPTTSQPTRFMVPGDPNLDQGPDDNIWIDGDNGYSGDKRLLMSSGPFTMAPGDSQEVVYGIILAADGDPLDSYTKLKTVDRTAQRFYDSGFRVASPPPAPGVRVTAYADGAVLTWDDHPENYYFTDFVDRLPVPVTFDTVWTTDILDSITVTIDTVISEFGDTTITIINDTSFYYIPVIESIDTTFQGEPTHFAFEGYNIYQVDRPFNPGQKWKLATFDRINNVTDIYDDIFDPDWGEFINVRVQQGSDSGIKHDFKVTRNEPDGQPFLVNREYYFGVSTYVYNPYGVPKTLESPLSIVKVRIERPTTWNEPDSLGAVGDQFVAEHMQGISDGRVAVVIVNPIDITGDTYQVSFDDFLVQDQDTTWILNWSLQNISTGESQIVHNTLFGFQNILTGETVGTYSTPIRDGFQIIVSSVNNGLKWIGVTANSTGTLASPVDALAYWYFPDYLIAGGDYTGQQSDPNIVWFLNVAPMYGMRDEDFMSSVFVNTGGYDVPGGPGIQWLVPDDFEIRFTGNGKAINYWVDDPSVIEVPFEWWNVGNPSDPGDDFQMIPYLKDEDGNGEWNLQYGREEADHDMSARLNDPWTDQVYILSPVDETPGTQGYDNFMAGAANGSDLPAWYAKPGDNDPGGPMNAWCAFARTVFVNWNGGDVIAATSPADYNAQSPEIGTVFRITTTKPITPDDIFEFSTLSAKGKATEYDPHRITVWPNPYFAYNPEESIYGGERMIFSGLPESGVCFIRIFDLSGRLVRLIDHSGQDTQHQVWDLRNNYGKPIASGMYLALIETDHGSVMRKLAVIR